MITLASRRDNEEAFWSGLLDGGSILGPSWHKIAPDFIVPDWYLDEPVVLGSEPWIHGSTDVQDSYILGLVTSTTALSIVTGKQ